MESIKIATDLDKAIKEKNNEEIINLILFKKRKERQEIRSEYYNIFKIDLLEVIEKNLFGNFKETLLVLFDNPIDYYCKQISYALNGLGTNEDTLIEIFYTNSPDEIKKIKARYPELFPGHTIEEDIKCNTSDYSQKLLLSLLEADRSVELCPNSKKCEALAKQLYEAGEKSLETAESVFTDILTKISRKESKLINEAYKKLTNQSFMDVIDKKFSGKSKRYLLEISILLICLPGFFAMKINKAMENYILNDYLFDDNLLIRVIVTRREKDMSLIKDHYEQNYKRDFIHDIKNNTKDYYQKLLVGLAVFAK